MDLNEQAEVDMPAKHLFDIGAGGRPDFFESRSAFAYDDRPL
jgi:hypothetical protein